MKLSHRKRLSSGFIVPTMVLIMVILTITAISLSTFAINHLNSVKTDFLGNSALLVAEAGAEQSLYQLNLNNSFTGYPTEQQFFSNTTQGRGTYQTQVIAGNIGNEKFIISTGRVYRRSSDSTPIETRKVKLTVVGTTANTYGVQTGPGGLLMSSSATIANGAVFVDGTLTMINSSRIGSVNSPVNVDAAFESCPPGGGASFPKVCSAGQPITLGNTSHIYGAVRATNQTNGANMSNTGLVPNSIVAPVGLPSYDRQAQVNAVTTTLTGSSASCGNKDTRTWQANTKITGNVTISQNCVVTILGNIWITGNFSLSNSSRLKVADSITSLPTIMVDGSAGATLSQSSAILANNSSLGAQIITFYSKASCSPDCATVTGSDLFNSRNVVTLSIGNSGLAAGSFFYARWSEIDVSQSGSIGGVLGQTVNLNNTGNISFGSNLSSGQSIWSIKNYQQVF